VAEIFAGRAQWGEAEDWYTETLRLQPMSPEAMAGLVRTAMAMGEPELAWERTMNGLLVHPDHAELALARASLLLAEGRAEAAGMEALRALEAMPGQPWAHLVYAETLWEQGNADPAIDALLEALRLAPTDLPTRMQLTTWLLEVGRNAEARRMISPAAKLLPDIEEVQQLAQAAEAAVEAELAGP
jgi:Flp pilus assembly protein TadD